MRFGTLALAMAAMGVAATARAAVTYTAVVDMRNVSGGNAAHVYDYYTASTSSFNTIFGPAAGGTAIAATLNDVTDGTTFVGNVRIAQNNGALGTTSTSGSGAWVAGSEAAAVFGPYVSDALGFIWAGQTTLYFTGLDTTGSTVYSFKMASLGNNSGFATSARIVSASSFTNSTTDIPVGPNNISSIYTTTTANDTALVMNDGQRVASFTNIVPSATGTFEIVWANPPAAFGTGNNGPRPSAFELVASPVPEPASLALVGLIALPLLRRRVA